MGAIGDMFNKIKAAASEAAEKQRAAQAQLRERMRPYHRGYDVFPDEVNWQYCAWVRRSLIKKLLIKGIVLAAIIVFIVISVVIKNYDTLPLMLICAFAALILLLSFIIGLNKEKKKLEELNRNYKGE